MADARTTRRLWLYGTTLVVVGVLAFLWVQRRRTDEADRVEYLRQVLANLDLVLSVDAQTALDTLDREFGDPGLPADLRRDVLRARAFAHAKRGEREAAEGRLDEALGLAPDEVTRAAVRIERALVRNATDDPGGALDLLEGWTPPDDPVLRVWAALARADAKRLGGSTDEAARILDEALAALPAPLPAGPERVLALSAWTPASAARQAAQGYMLLVEDEGERARFRRRLEALDPEGALDPVGD